MTTVTAKERGTARDSLRILNDHKSICDGKNGVGNKRGSEKRVIYNNISNRTRLVVKIEKKLTRNVIKLKSLSQNIPCRYHGFNIPAERNGDMRILR